MTQEEKNKILVNYITELEDTARQEERERCIRMFCNSCPYYGIGKDCECTHFEAFRKAIEEGGSNGN